MALSAATVWEVRPTVGSDTACGGGFVTGSGGTDRSQQNSAFVTFDGVTIAAHTTGVTTTIILTGYTVVSGDVGNILQITGGTNFTTGFYQIVSVSTGANTWTLDRNTTSGVGTGMTGAMGGALASLGQAFTNAIGGNIIYAKATGSNVTTSAQSLNLQNSTPIRIVGYTSSRGDSGQFTWTTSTNSIHLIDFGGSNPYNYSFENITLSSTAGTRGNGIHALGSNVGAIRLYNCILDGFNIGIDGLFSGNFGIATLLLEKTEIKNCVSHGLANDGQNIILNCYIHDNGGDGIHGENAIGQVTGPLFVSYSLIANNTGDGINYSISAGNPYNSAYEWVTILNSILYGNGSDGIIIGGSSNPGGGICAWNNIFYTNIQSGIELTGSPPNYTFVSLQNNAYGANGGSPTTGIPSGIEVGAITLTGNPFTNAAGLDFSLNNTAGAGASCRGAGIPTTIPGTTPSTPGSMALGPLQIAGGGGSITNYIISPSITRIIIEGESN